MMTVTEVNFPLWKLMIVSALYEIVIKIVDDDIDSTVSST